MYAFEKKLSNVLHNAFREFNMKNAILAYVFSKTCYINETMHLIFAAAVFTVHDAIGRI